MLWAQVALGHRGFVELLSTTDLAGSRQVAGMGTVEHGDGAGVDGH